MNLFITALYYHGEGVPIGHGPNVTVGCAQSYCNNSDFNERAIESLRESSEEVWGWSNSENARHCPPPFPLPLSLSPSLSLTLPLSHSAPPVEIHPSS